MLDIVANILEIVVSVITINGIIIASFHKWIKKPLMKKYDTFCEKIANIDNIAQKVEKQMTVQVIPFVKSFEAEFSTNSGKSLKDRITRIDNSLKKEELRNKLLADNLTTIGTYECDGSGECVWANKSLCNMFGLPLSDMLGHGWLSSICESERTDVWMNWLEDIKFGIPYESSYMVCNQKTGETFKCRSNAIGHRDSNGNIIGYYGTVVKL